MSTKKRFNQVQPLLYIDNPEHSLVRDGDNELELLYKKKNTEQFSHLTEEVEETKEAAPINEVEKSNPNSKGRTFDLTRHLGYDWQKGKESNITEANEMLRAALEDQDYGRSRQKKERPSEEEDDKEKGVREVGGVSEPVGRRGNFVEKEDRVQNERKKSFEDKSVQEKAELLYKMRMLNPMVCICKTPQETWVGNVTAIEDEQFTMQTQQLPYLVTIKYEDVVELSLDHFS